MFKFFASLMVYFEVVIENIMLFCQHNNVTDHWKLPVRRIMFAFVLNFNVVVTGFIM
jgi:hypothetical protein